jgi:hypothetical protein
MPARVPSIYQHDDHGHPRGTGLRLESRKFELQVMVIDHMEPPNEN